VKDLLTAKSEGDVRIERSQSAEEKLRQTTELMESDQKAFKIVKEKLCRVSKKLLPILRPFLVSCCRELDALMAIDISEKEYLLVFSGQFCLFFYSTSEVTTKICVFSAGVEQDWVSTWTRKEERRGVARLCSQRHLSQLVRDLIFLLCSGLVAQFVCLSVYLPACLSVYLSGCLFVCLSVCFTVHVLD